MSLTSDLKQRTLWLILALTLFLAGGCEPVQQRQQLGQVLEQDVLRVGTLYGLTTYYHGANGEQGFEYELVKGFADYLDVRLEVLPYYNLQTAFEQLEAGQLDLIAAGLSVTERRLKRVNFGPGYQSVTQKLVFKQGQERPRDPSDLSGNLIVVADSSHSETLQQLKKQYPELEWQETTEMDNEELLEAVMRGDYDYTVADSNILALMRRRYPGLSIGFTIHSTQPVAWALNQQGDDSLRGALLDYFGQLQDDGRLAALEDKYFGHVRQFNYVDTRLFIKAVENTLPDYRHWFEQYADDLDWRLLAALSYQESHWDPRAKSPTGVRGIMMLTLPTARDMNVRSRLDAEQNIRGGAQYLRELYRRIPARIEDPDRLWFTLAAYNVGLGHLEDARVLTERQGGNPDLWVDVKQRLPLLRQKKYYRTTRYGYARGDEAVTYVSNIRRYYDTLVWLDEQEVIPAARQGVEDRQISDSD
ncbi:Membrane-bound lytic murein transglycosylase [Saliniradius amylolyticus]|uniref:Membrane-bound lytic murein transglycosylase F n=1 Tax=Saliniradius amylolyticus TaxID=2183582 RepID=A0A2S2E4V0_9ALTE|nr:membrane-bound lytic murein transglycosylase MltF [Saliniradius amylolyticus]AWL12688.1 Membrane-bound lytic murein transglycosylase [Saliniradius amylolyticus]